MKKSIGILALAQNRPIAESVALAAEASFDAVELLIAPDGPLTYATPEAECRRIADDFARADLSVSALATKLLPGSSLISSDSAARPTAARQITDALVRARWLSTDAIVVPLRPAVGSPPTPSDATFETIHALALEALLALRFEAEQQAVHIVCGTEWNRFFASPLEVRRFIDEVNSPWVGASLDLTATLPEGHTEDWITLLGHRIIRIYLGDDGPTSRADAAAGSADQHRLARPSLTEALRCIRYDGPLTCRGRQEARQAQALLEDLLSVMAHSGHEDG